MQENPNQKGIEILCIGSELLLGNILNSNAKWIAEELAGSIRKTLAEEWIEEKKNPPTPPEVSKALPW